MSLCYNILDLLERGVQMNHNLLLYIFYGLVSGFSEFTPLSQSAHQALFPMVLNFDSTWPLLRFFVHLGALGGLVFLNWQKLNHFYHEIKMFSVSPRYRKRPSDVGAVLDVRLVIMAFVPMMIGAVLSAFTANIIVNLLLLALMLVLGAVLIYIPDYIPGGNRKTLEMSPLDGLLLGICAACSVIPGISAVGLMLFVGLIRKCDREYILELVLIIFGVMLAGLVVVDAIAVVFSGLAGFSILRLLGSFLACAAAFGGSVGAIFMMRFLAVKTGFSGFAFYGWGLGLFSFILYLMV